MSKRAWPFESGETPAGHPEAGKERRPGRMHAIFKAVVLLALLAATAYGLLRDGLYDEDLFLPVAAGVLALTLVTLFMRGYYRGVPRVGWVLVALLAVLVGVKGLSMVWTISETETVNETLRSSMYLATFAVALAAFTSGRQAGPIIDVSILAAAAVAGYGLLQKISPIQYPIQGVDVVRVDSTVGYPNTTAVVLGMAVVLALARIPTTRNALFRGLYAALVLAFLVTIYLTQSRGGIGSLGVGMIFLFVFGKDRLQLATNLLLLSVPGAWLYARMQALDGLFLAEVSREREVADGAAFGTALIVGLVAAFVLQAAYAFLADRYELTSQARRAVGALVLAGVLVAAGVGAFVVVRGYGGVGQAYEALVSNPNQTEDARERLASLSVGFRAAYWEVAWEEWRQRPLTGTGAGTFYFTWLENRTGTQSVRQVHNVYLEQGTETGVVAFVALVGFAAVLVGYVARATWRSGGERRLLLAGLLSAIVIYLISSVVEWHWYLPASTLLFFILAAVAVKYASMDDSDGAEAEDAPSRR